MSQIRILIADDHPVFLNGLNMLLKMKDSNINVVEVVSNGREVLDKLEQIDVDVVLLDIRMPEMDGIEAARFVRHRYPEIKIIVLTTFDDRRLIQDALHAGASGYLLKDAPVEKIIAAIKSVNEGNVLISPKVAAVLGTHDEKSTLEENQDLEAQEKINDLSPREQEVIFLLAKGMNNLEIAEELFISERTVRNYVSHIYDIIGVHSRLEAIKWAKKHGIAIP